MSEFIATCPKCQQQILCDTAYVGKRIACPVCLQEIQMPEPSQRGNQPAANGPSAASAAVTNPGGKGSSLMTFALPGAVGLILLAAGAIFFLRKPSTDAAPTPTTSSQAPSSGLSSRPTLPAKMADTGQCRVIWTFDQDHGDTVPDATGHGYEARIKGDSTVWIKAANPYSYGLQLGGTNCVEMDRPVVNTAKSFTVSAWVRLDALKVGSIQGIVSIDGNYLSAFNLAFYAASAQVGGEFELIRRSGDSKDATQFKAIGKSGLTTNSWYHVTGVYDDSAQTISVYLNGECQATAPCTNSWQALGKTAIGRGRWQGRESSYLAGTIRDVRIYASALSAGQIQDMAR